MEFTDCVKERLVLGLKSSLLCAVMLMPATALCQSPAEADDEEPDQIALTMVSDSATTEAATAYPSDQRKIDRLSGHIQRRYRVPDGKAQHIVAEAVRNGRTHQVEPELILAIIAVESTFKERAVSRVGARGLMQVMPGAHSRKTREIGGSHALFDPTKNIYIGSRILANYLNSHSGNLRRALLSYNGSLGSRSSFPERVIRIYQDLRRTTTEG